LIYNQPNNGNLQLVRTTNKSIPKFVKCHKDKHPKHFAVGRRGKYVGTMANGKLFKVINVYDSDDKREFWLNTSNVPI